MSELKFGNNLSSIKFGNNRKVVFYIASGRLSDWRYDTLSDGQIVLCEYLWQYDSTVPVYVPTAGGKTMINNYLSGDTPAVSNTPFLNNPDVVSVDLQSVPFRINNMSYAFYNCQNLVSVNNINPNVTNMARSFYNCVNLNQNIQIPNSVTNMTSTFLDCYNLNQNIQIPNSVINMARTFDYCNNLQGTINILSDQITNANRCFYDTSLPKNVYIPFKYSNGVNSATFNSFVSAGYLTADGTSTGQNGVTIYNYSGNGTTQHTDTGDDGGNDPDPWNDDGW